MPSEPLATRSHSASRLSWLGLAAVMGGAGIAHFAVPSAFERIVPRLLGHQRALVQLSGVAELIAGVLLLSPRTRRIGGWWTVALLVMVFPANIQMAVDSGVGARGFPVNSAGLAWLRLPFQAPLVWWAYRQTH